MNRLTPFNNLRNPWFRDYWQESFGCRIPQDDVGRRRYLSGPGGGMSPLNGLGGGGGGVTAFAKTCDMRKRLADLNNYEQDSKVQFVIDAVYAFAIALDKLREDACPPSQSGMCPQMAHYDGGQFYQNYLLKVDFTGWWSVAEPLARARTFVPLFLDFFDKNSPNGTYRNQMLQTNKWRACLSS